MTKVLKLARELTDKPTFISNMAFVFAVFSVASGVMFLVIDASVGGVIAFVVVLAAAALTMLAVRDDLADARAYAKNRKQQKVNA